MQRKNTYFLSDAHLGAKILKDNKEREARLVAFLESVREDCRALYLLGDMFDFWFEYRRAVPKGHVRFLAELAHFADEGVEVHFFTGNHDVWAFGYLADECGVTLHSGQEETAPAADNRVQALQTLLAALEEREAILSVMGEAGIESEALHECMV